MIRKHLCKVYLVFISSIFFVFSIKLSIEDVVLRNSNLLTVINLKFSLVCIFIFSSFNLCVKFADSSFFIKSSYFTAVILCITNEACCVSVKLGIISR